MSRNVTVFRATLTIGRKRISLSYFVSSSATALSSMISVLMAFSVGKVAVTSANEKGRMKPAFAEWRELLQQTDFFVELLSARVQRNARASDRTGTNNRFALRVA